MEASFRIATVIESRQVINEFKNFSKALSHSSLSFFALSIDCIVFSYQLIYGDPFYRYILLTFLLILIIFNFVSFAKK